MADQATSQPIAGVPADSQWLGELYVKYEAGLRRFVTGVLRDADTADEIVQSTFAKATQVGGEVRPEAIKSWLYRVAFNEAISWKRRSRTDQAAREQVGRRNDQITESPEQSLIRRELVEQVRTAIAGLSAAQQRVVSLRMYEQKTFAQIAAETGMPLGTVLTHMRRGLEKLRHTLKRKE
jgi:RNA polymerase sigma-70 factor (ECF subfamily)